MELSHFVSMVQYEILKSFDFSEYLQKEIETDVNQPIQLAIEAAEIEIPLIFNVREKTVNLEEITKEVNERASHSKTHIDMPFSKKVSDFKIKRNVFGERGESPLSKTKLKKREVSNKNRQIETPSEDVNQDGQTTGITIEVQVANPKSKRDEDFDTSLIGRIKVIVKPITK